ncbi:MAG: hypothetical protein RMM53_04775, partial [Bacteroidia bacterium]|nr:hypothetical protein [Bacteroidia bacterium]
LKQSESPSDYGSRVEFEQYAASPVGAGFKPPFESRPNFGWSMASRSRIGRLLIADAKLIDYICLRKRLAQNEQ